MCSSNGSPAIFRNPDGGSAKHSEIMAENKLLDSEKVTAGLYFQAKSRG